MKYRIGMVIAGILLLIGGFTVISAKNYVENLPIVALTSTVSNFIRENLTVNGRLYYEDVEAVELPVGCHVEKVYVKVGDLVEAGAALLQLKEADVQIVYHQKKLEMESLEKAGEDDATRGKLAYWQLQIAVEELEVLERLIANDYTVCAASDAYVISQGYEEGKKTTNTSLLELGITESGCYLEWTLSPEEYREYTGTAIIGGVQKKLLWEKPSYEKGGYLYHAKLPEVTECTHGEQVEVSLIYVSDEYRAVLPKSCIQYDTDGTTYVYEVSTRSRNFGKESYVVKVGVTIEEQDDVNVAVKSPLTAIVSGSTKKLSDMAAVAVLEE